MLVDAPVAAAPRTRHRCLSSDEAAFIQAVCKLVLPEARPVSAPAYIDRKLHELSRTDAGATALALYRDGVSGIQMRCRMEHDCAFQMLDVWHQLAILAQLDEPRNVPADLRAFMYKMLNDLAEAYFDAERTLPDGDGGRSVRRIARIGAGSRSIVRACPSSRLSSRARSARKSRARCSFA